MSLLPQLTPATALGAVFAAAYAAPQGNVAAASPGGPAPVLTPDQVGKTVTDLVTGQDDGQAAYLVTPAGLRPLT